MCLVCHHVFRRSCRRPLTGRTSTAEIKRNATLTCGERPMVDFFWPGTRRLGLAATKGRPTRAWDFSTPGYSDWTPGETRFGKQTLAMDATTRSGTCWKQAMADVCWW